jgi:predicted amidophosphoribosyltransferase
MTSGNYACPTCGYENLEPGLCPDCSMNLEEVCPDCGNATSACTCEGKEEENAEKEEKE